MLPQLNIVNQNTITILQTNHETTMDNRRIEQLETKDPSEETLQLTNSWKELVKPGEYRTSTGVWKKYNPPRYDRADIKRIEMNLNQRRKRLHWNCMEKQDKESVEDTTRKEELNRVIERTRNLPQKQKGDHPGTSDGTQEVESPPETTETESTSSVESFGVPAINFKKYLGTTGERYNQMIQASHIQNENQMGIGGDYPASRAKIHYRNNQ